jgi:hypothetical protein
MGSNSAFLALKIVVIREISSVRNTPLACHHNPLKNGRVRRSIPLFTFRESCRTSPEAGPAATAVVQQKALFPVLLLTDYAPENYAFERAGGSVRWNCDWSDGESRPWCGQILLVRKRAFSVLLVLEHFMSGCEKWLGG